jgi:hypothetical protein
MVTLWSRAHYREMHTWDSDGEHGMRERICGGIPANERVGDYNSKGRPQSFRGKLFLSQNQLIRQPPYAQ